MFRLLITGSRDWSDTVAIENEFRLVYAKYGKEVVLVSGGAKGADSLCENLARKAGWKIEQHIPNWNEEGKKAGFLRNEKMVKLGADACLAFIKNASKGATHCSNFAISNNIPTKRVVG